MGWEIVRKFVVIVMIRFRIYFKKWEKVNDKFIGGEEVMGLRILNFRKINLYDNWNYNRNSVRGD